jgi:hypothetical protein
MKDFPAANDLPMLAIITKFQLNAEENLLKTLQKDQNKLLALSSQIFQEIIESQGKKNISNRSAKAICLDWKKLQLSVEQKATVDKILDYLDALEKTSHQILFLAEFFKDHAIGKILDDYFECDQHNTAN